MPTHPVAQPGLDITAEGRSLLDTLAHGDVAAWITAHPGVVSPQ